MQTELKPGRRWRTGIKIATAGVVGGTLLMPSVSPATHVIKAAQDVFVANTESNPVPTKAVGTTGVRVENGDDRPVPVTGAVDANIQGTPTVRVQGPATEPLSRKFSILFANARTNGIDAYTVPEGKRLLVEFVTFHDSDHMARLSRFRAQVGDVQHDLMPTVTADGPGDLVSQAVKIVVDAGKTLTFRATFTEPVGEEDYDGYGFGPVQLDGSWTGTLTDVDSGDGSTG